MEFINQLSKSEPFILLCPEEKTGPLKQIADLFENRTVINFANISTAQDDSANGIFCAIPDGKYNSSVLAKLFNILKPGGKLVVDKPTDLEKIKFDLTLNGFMNVKVGSDGLTAIRPQFKTGSSVKLNLTKKPTPAVWKLNDSDEEEIIDPDILLDEDDLKKPDPLSLKVCSTTGKRKACKDCSCGLADELSLQDQPDKKIESKEAPNSSCGSCYLGDAFRCSTCPYLGMPAFKPGEKIQLVGSQLQDDV